VLGLIIINPMASSSDFSILFSLTVSPRPRCSVDKHRSLPPVEIEKKNKYIFVFPYSAIIIIFSLKRIEDETIFSSNKKLAGGIQVIRFLYNTL